MQVPAAVLSGNTCEKSVNKTGGNIRKIQGKYLPLLFTPC